MHMCLFETGQKGTRPGAAAGPDSHELCWAPDGCRNGVLQRRGRHRSSSQGSGLWMLLRAISIRIQLKCVLTLV